MPLTELEVRSSTAKDSDYKLSDGGGLYLHVAATGRKYWRMAYRFAGKQKTLAIGVYPTVSLKSARTEREAARRLLHDSIDPSAHKQLRKSMLFEANSNTFGPVAIEWLSKMSPSWAVSHSKRVESNLKDDVLPYLGNRPICEISSVEVLNVLQRIESRGALETAHRTKQRIGMIFRYAVASGRAERDPTFDLKGALPPATVNHFSHLTDEGRLAEVLRGIKAYKGTPTVRAALQIAPYVFVRPTNLRHAEWGEFDLANKIWRIPATKMKTAHPHIVPLPTQVVSLLTELAQLTSSQQWVFPSARGKTRPMSDNAILMALRSLGVEKHEMTGHGFRHTASTFLHEAGWESDVIERQLAHKALGIRGIYDHSQHLEKRKKMMQSWADYLDRIRDERND